MTYTVAYQSAHRSAELTHHEKVDLQEIHESRKELARVANANSTRGALINILDSEIVAAPVDIIDNVRGLIEELKPGCRLAFVAVPEAQEVISMVVTTVAHGHGAKVMGFADLDEARSWIRGASRPA
ncbi:MAG: hypothetical protein JJ884_11200 [Maricaulis sp.]|jgi:hypothetical protein|uniref:hypothetical protein n=1 Tax=Maricaulis sp. TaxID=1486257 RepID=UPI001B187BF9|nr:hypothetical protein [Maricaulis sp.]MBO6729844.1 hypothetical protein [Maricaulis sp.]MBO6848074.1 hypothetical protein [Maricaulis sp.]MBO6877852.1 hypothetical protein [Maricaulis sp.]